MTIWGGHIVIALFYACALGKFFRSRKFQIVNFFRTDYVKSVKFSLPAPLSSIIGAPYGLHDTSFKCARSSPVCRHTMSHVNLGKRNLDDNDCHSHLGGISAQMRPIFTFRGPYGLHDTSFKCARTELDESG